MDRKKAASRSRSPTTRRSRKAPLRTPSDPIQYRGGNRSHTRSTHDISLTRSHHRTGPPLPNRGRSISPSARPKSGRSISSPFHSDRQAGGTKSTIPKMRQRKSVSPSARSKGRGRSVSPSAQRAPKRASYREKKPISMGGFSSHVREPDPINSSSIHRQPPTRARTTSPAVKSRGRSKSPSGRQPPTGTSTEMKRGRRPSKVAPGAHDRSVHSRSGHSIMIDDNESTNAEYRTNRDDSYEEKSFRIDKRLYRSFRKGISEREGISWKKCCCYFVPICILSCATVGLIVATGNTPDGVKDALDGIIPTFDNSELKDPFSGSIAAVPKWAAGGNGLHVTIVNALSDDWQVPFDLATADWELGGSPSAVDIKVETVPHEIACETVDGKVKVCNGDYGDSKWRGVNEATLDSENQILSTAVRVNEFYLFNMGKGAWQYTLCHEIGHALGLAHTDESFDNKDLGNCLDYTDNMDANKHPDQGLYDTLLDLYGPISDRRLLRGGSIGNDRTSSALTPNHIRQRRSEVVRKFLNRRDDNGYEDGWSLLHRNSHGEEHELDLGQGYKVRVHMLLA